MIEVKRASPRYGGVETARIQKKVSSEAEETDATVNALVDEYRARCLWFLRSDWYPSTIEDRLRALEYIERHGDVAAFKRARGLRAWLSRSSKEAFAG